MPKSESVKFKDDPKEREKEKESSASASSSKESELKKKGSISVGLAARMKKRVTDTRAVLDEEHPAHIRRKKYEETRRYVNKLVEHPGHSNTSFIICGFIFFMIILSTIFCCAETLPVLETPYWRNFFWVADLIFVIFFSIELVIRFWASDNREGFALQPLNVIDLVALIPFYIEFLVWMFFVSAHSNEVFRALQTIRILRFIRVGKFSAQMQFISEGLLRSVQSFLLMAYMLAAGLLLCSSCLFVLERGEWDSKKGCFARENEVFFSGCSPFESVPMSAWWAITTMTTVGFGDAYPLTAPGRIAAGCTMVLGLLTVAIPTTVLSVEFAIAYKQQLKEKKDYKVRKSLIHRTKDELILHTSMQKLNILIDKFQDHLPYLKHLVMADLEMNLPVEDHPKLDPTFSIFRNNVMNDLSNLKFFVDANTAHLIY